jgi:predicted aspartyl protease
MRTTPARRLRAATLGPILLGLLCQVSLPAQADSPAARLDFTMGPRGHLLMPAIINGSAQGTFALDTGASSTVITPEFAARVDSLKRGESAHAIGAHSTTSVEIVRLESLRLGELDIGEGRAVIMDLSHVNGPDMTLDGIVGNNYLDQFDVVIDLADSEAILLQRGSLSQSADGFVTSVAIGDGHGKLIYLDIMLNGQLMKAILDTGSGRSIINSAGARALGAEFAPHETAADGHPGGHRLLARIDDVSIRLGDATLTHDSSLEVRDLSVFSSVGSDDEPFVLIGTDLLNDRRVGIDYSARRLYL